MDTVKVFRSGNSQAVRLPKAYRFNAEEIEIFRRGDEVVLREKRPTLDEVLSDLPTWPEDITPDNIPDLPPEHRTSW